MINVDHDDLLLPKLGETIQSDNGLEAALTHAYPRTHCTDQP